MGIVPVMVATIVGGLFGVVAGYAGGGLNMVIMRAWTCSSPFRRCCWRSRFPAVWAAA